MMMSLMSRSVMRARRRESPDTRAAVAYLEASGATAITITEHDGVCAFRVGHKIDPDAVAIFWIMEADAKPVVARARKLAGKSADATASLRQAATDLRATLTPHATAMARAGAAAERLDGYIESLRARGAMKEFTRAFRRRRLAAAANGQGFMSFAVAEARLRKALVPLLLGGNNIRVQSLFAAIFDR
jgi:hypothetical protein